MDTKTPAITIVCDVWGGNMQAKKQWQVVLYTTGVLTFVSNTPNENRKDEVRLSKKYCCRHTRLPHAKKNGEQALQTVGDHLLDFSACFVHSPGLGCPQRSP